MYDYPLTKSKLEENELFRSIKPNDVLKEEEQWQAALGVLKEFRLAWHPDHPKNWDSLAALKMILLSTDRDGKVLDAGGEYYSVLLHQLKSFGFHDLTAINTSFNMNEIRDGIRFNYGDITHADYDDAAFDAVSCLSVIEHGVDTRSYVREMARILKPNGLLFTSVDYWPTPVDTGGQVAYGVPIRIFTKQDIIELVKIGMEYGLKLVGQLETRAENRVVHWTEFDLRYTFLYITMIKSAR
jgi:SAM-dependent methyltransferase